MDHPIHAYRALYRTALRAVHFSAPARYQIRDILRSSFRSPSPSPSSPSSPPPSPSPAASARRITNTVNFLRRASTHTGIEHRILRNLLHARYWSPDNKDDPKKQRAETMDRGAVWVRENSERGRKLRRESGYAGMKVTVGLLNESMELCLRM